MTGKGAARREVKRMFREGLGAAPPPEAAVGSLRASAGKSVRQKSDRTEQLNVRVPAELKKRVRQLAMRDGISISEVIVRALGLYDDNP